MNTERLERKRQSQYYITRVGEALKINKLEFNEKHHYYIEEGHSQMGRETGT